MNVKPELSLIIPAYNEALRIEPMLRDLLWSFEKLSNEKCEMLVVMDGCNDTTPHIVKRITNDHPLVTALVFPNRLGKGGAIMEALKYVQGDIVAFIDADGSIPSRELKNLIRWTRRFDLVIGSRYRKDSKVLIRRPFVRFLFSRAFRVFVYLFFPRLNGISDTQCGVKVFKRSLTDAIREDFLVSDFAFDLNLIYSVLSRGYTVKEVGVTWIEKEGSKLSSGIVGQVFVMLLSIVRLRMYYSQFRKVLSARMFEKLAGLVYKRFQF